MQTLRLQVLTFAVLFKLSQSDLQVPYLFIQTLYFQLQGLDAIVRARLSQTNAFLALRAPSLPFSALFLMLCKFFAHELFFAILALH